MKEAINDQPGAGRRYAKYSWLLYMGLLLVLGLGRMVQKLITESGGFGSRYGPVLAAVLIIIGVFGAVFQRPIARQWFWKGVFWLLGIVSVGLFAMVVYLLFAVGSGSFNVAGLLVGILVVLMPAQWQLFVYTYRSSSLWNRAADTAGPVEQNA